MGFTFLPKLIKIVQNPFSTNAVTTFDSCTRSHDNFKSGDDSHDDDLYYRTQKYITQVAHPDLTVTPGSPFQAAPERIQILHWNLFYLPFLLLRGTLLVQEETRRVAEWIPSI